MSTCNIHLFGSSYTLDALTEHRLACDLAARMEAITLVFQGQGHWQRSYVKDIEGKRTEAIAHYEAAQAAFVDASSFFKSAEFARAKLVSHFVSVHPDYAVRPAVKAALESQDVSSVVSEMKREGRLPQFVEGADLQALASNVANLRHNSLETPSTGDSVVDRIVWFLAVDLQKLQELRRKCNEIAKTLETEKSQVERGTLYESLGHTIHAGKRLYGLSTLTGQIRVEMIEYLSWVELYGGFITSSLLQASDDDDIEKWRQVSPLVE